MADDRNKAEEMLRDSKDQTRHSAEASDTSQPENTPGSLHEAVRKGHARIDADEMPENLTIRDGRLAALIWGLEETDQLAAVAADAGAELGRDSDDTRETRAATLRLLVRVGLREVAPETMQTAVEARKEYLTEQADEF
ncbi:hypothetical protein [Halococcus sp. PRR34]|uniref:hypothetical protein n=1 Tax=Halococcus sp. PRR34 TaxID=3020830 RepID=UPI0023617E7D|nr:hypothetical protein [Halococcus sp. PRR34]